jgi:hypothetical protein
MMRSCTCGKENVCCFKGNTFSTIITNYLFKVYFKSNQFNLTVWLHRVSFNYIIKYKNRILRLGASINIHKNICSQLLRSRDMATMHYFRETLFQQQFTINVWAEKIYDLRGPYEPLLSGVSYLKFITKTLQQLMDDVPLATPQTMWVPHDVAPAYSSRNFMLYSNSRYSLSVWWIEQKGPIVWPLRSPDLTPAYFYLWSHLKSIFYTERCNTRGDLWNATEAAGVTSGDMPGVFQRTRNSWRNRAIMHWLQWWTVSTSSVNR